MGKKLGFLIGIYIFSYIFNYNVLAREVIFEAEDIVVAEKTANAYGGIIKSCFDGIAVMDIPDGQPGVTDPDSGIGGDNGELVQLAELPIIYDNHVFEIEDAEKTVTRSCIVKTENCGIDSQTDPGFSKQWQHDFMSTEKLWNYATGEGVTVAVIDTGINDIPDFNDINIDFDNAYSGITGDTGAASVTDLKNHGTCVAGIIAAAAGNGIDGAGIAPDVNIIPLKAADDSGQVMEDALLRTIKRAAELDADVINISIGGAAYSPLLEKYVAEAKNSGAFVVCAAGNEGTDVLRYPAAFPDTVAVGALERDNAGTIQLAEYSQYGKFVDIAAPGSGIYTTDKNGGFASFTGTSAASPVVSAAAALVISYRKDLKNKPLETRNIILNTAYQKEYVCDKNGGVVFRGINVLGALYYMKMAGRIPAVIADETEIVSEDGKQIAGEGKHLILSTEAEGAEIYYTVDGKKPSVNSGVKYTNPVELTEAGFGVPDINGKQNIRAAVVLGNYTSEILNLKYNFIVKAKKITGNNGKILYVSAGSKVLLDTVFEPANTTDQRMAYSIVSGEGGSIVSNRYLKIDKDVKVGNRIILNGKSLDGTMLTTDIIVEVVSDKAGFIKQKSKKIKVLTEKAVRMDKTYQNCNLMDYIITDSVSVNIIFKNSRPDIIHVSPEGMITGKKSGKAVVSCSLNNGSAKNVKFKIESLTPVVSIDEVRTTNGFKKIAGRKYLNYSFKMSNITEPLVEIPVAAGGKIRLIPVLNNGDLNRIPTDKKMHYRSDDPDIKVKNGILCINKNAVSKSSVVTLEASDGFGAEIDIPIRIYGRYKNWKFDIKNVEINRAELVPLNRVESHITAVSSADGIERCPYYEILSSKEDVVGFMTDITGRYIVAAKSGKARFTVRPVDGTKTRAVIDVFVKK